MNKKVFPLYIVICMLYFNPAFSNQYIITGQYYTGCQDKKYEETLINYAVNHDIEAFKKGLAIGIYHGNCTAFKQGETVYVTETSVLSGMVKIRRKGQSQEYWTIIEAIKSN